MKLFNNVYYVKSNPISIPNPHLGMIVPIFSLSSVVSYRYVATFFELWINVNPEKIENINSEFAVFNAPLGINFNPISKSAAKESNFGLTIECTFSSFSIEFYTT